MPESQGSLSYVCGTSDIPLIGGTIGAFFDGAAARWGSRDALIVRHQGIRWTWAELKREVDRVASGLLALGLRPGECIGIWSPNNAEWTLTQFAAAKAGIILVTVNPAYRTSELEYALNLSRCKALVMARSFKSSDYVGMLRNLAPELDAGGQPLRSARLPHLQLPILIGDAPEPGFLRFADIAAAATAESDTELGALGGKLQFDDAINVQFTSGTTGFPKGATLSHHNILNNGFYVAEAIRLTETDRLCIPVPLYHCFGMVMANLGCLTHGAAMIYPSEGFDPLAVLQAVHEERCTALYGVPTMFIAELDHPDFAKYDLNSLRTGIMAGAPCPIEVMRKVMERMHMRDITIAYGMTETSPVSFQSAVDDPVERRVSTVGRVQPHLEVKIIDAEGRIVPRGTPGELCTRGYSVMLGYWDQDDKTREVIDRARWMHTGDLAAIDADGYCAIVGRIKDLVIRGGENIYPREVEEFLYRHPKVQAVQVVGVPDPKYGEELCAWVRLNEGASATEEEIRAFCRGQIAHQKIPRYIRFVDEFPMTVTGKIQKFIIRDRMVAELGLGEGDAGARPAALAQSAAG
jgi:fatty-acyl-CoA synthase